MLIGQISTLIADSAADSSFYTDQAKAAVSFDALDEAGLKALTLSQSTAGQDNFFIESSPKLMLFENAQKKKGVILIKAFVQDGANSRIRFDVKVLY